MKLKWRQNDWWIEKIFESVETDWRERAKVLPGRFVLWIKLTKTAQSGTKHDSS